MRGRPDVLAGGGGKATSVRRATSPTFAGGGNGPPMWAQPQCGEEA